MNARQRSFAISGCPHRATAAPVRSPPRDEPSLDADPLLDIDQTRDLLTRANSIDPSNSRPYPPPETRIHECCNRLCSGANDCGWA
jgi:hypothetical protein